MIYLKINENTYPAIIDGTMVDYAWDNRQSKSITLSKTYDEVLALLPDNTSWSIVMDDEEYDNSEYCMSGAITDNRDGTVTIKMGKPTDLEEAYEMLIGG